jgi:hypothetical protein
MRKTTSMWFFGAIVLGIIAGIAIIFGVNQTTNETSAQTVEKPNSSTNGDKSANRWKPESFPIQTSGSTFALNLPENLKQNDLAVGIKIIKAGEKESVTVARLFWSENKGYEQVQPSRVSKVEDYPVEAVSLVDGSMTLGETVSGLSKDIVGEGVVIWIEKFEKTQLSIKQGGKLFLSDSKNNLLIQGEESNESRLDNMAHLLGVYSAKHSIADLKAKGHEVTVSEKGGKKNE